MIKLKTKKILKNSSIENYVDAYAKNKLDTDKIFNMPVDCAVYSNTTFYGLTNNNTNIFIKNVIENLTTKEKNELKKLINYQQTDLNDYIQYSLYNFNCEDINNCNAVLRKKAIKKISNIIEEK